MEVTPITICTESLLFRLCCFSRIAFIVLAIIADAIFNDHIATGVETFPIDYSSVYTEILLRPFTKWDAAHFLQIASHGYQKPTQFVFFPLYPWLLSLSGKFLSYFQSLFSVALLNNEEVLVLSALLLNGISFIFAFLVLRKMLENWQVSSRVRQIALLCFIFNPASIFFVSAYSESLFCALSWYGMFLLDTSYSSFAVLPFILSSFVRSNGNFVVVLIAGRYFCEIIHNYASMTLSRSLTVGLTILWILTPYFVINWYHHNNLCSGTIPDRFPQIFEDVCSESFHFYSLYSYLQAEFWNVGLLKYYQLKQIPNFFLAAPISAVAIVGALEKTRLMENTGAIEPLGLRGSESTNGEYDLKKRAPLLGGFVLHYFDFIDNVDFLPYYLHLGLVLFVVLFLANVQIMTRVLSSASPLIYVVLAYLLTDKRRCTSKWIGGWSTSSFVLLYLVVYNVLGVILHVNFYPWT